MKNLYLKIAAVCAMILCCIQAIKAQEVEFTFDAAGNQTVRQWVCVGCSTYSSAPFYSSPVALMPASATVKDNTVSKRSLIAFPNPFTESLNLKWTNYDYYLKSVVVSSLSGASVFKQDYPYIEGQQQITIPFNNQVSGMYVILATYSDGKQEIIKVVKIAH